jgi:hypothetical protein
VVAGTLLETVERFIQLEDFVILIESSGNPHKEGCVDVCLKKGSDIVYSFVESQRRMDIMRRSRTVVRLTTGAKVSVKSIPSTCQF